MFSSDPTNSKEYCLVDESYDLLLMSSAHTGLVTSWKNEYVFVSLLFPVVSTNAPLFIVIPTFPPAKLLTVIGYVIVLFCDIVGVPIMISLELTTLPSVDISKFPLKVDTLVFNAVSSEPVKLNLKVPN